MDWWSDGENLEAKPVDWWSDGENLEAKLRARSQPLLQELYKSMARFFGRYEHALDAKGRLILPAKFRQSFDPKGFLTQFNDRCLALWTPEDFEKQMTIMEANQQESTEQRHLARLWAAGTQEIEVDKQGRMAIPGFLREYAHLSTDVLVMGAIDRIELWAPEVWEAKVAPSLAQLTDEN